MKSIAFPGGDRLEFLYDFAGNLIEVRNIAGGVIETKGFVLDDLTNVVSLDDGNGGPISILSGRSIDQHLANVNPDGTTQFCMTDSLNSSANAISIASSVWPCNTKTPT